jgi:ATP-dependent helicase HrpA
MPLTRAVTYPDRHVRSPGERGGRPAVSSPPAGGARRRPANRPRGSRAAGQGAAGQGGDGQGAAGQGAAGQGAAGQGAAGQGAAGQARRRAAVPAVRYPPELPVSQARDEIAAAIRDHQVVIVAGETGSGKTTQLPKICLELGRGVLGMIGHTQPRRIAARTVATRIAAELDTPLGAAVGYQVRFTGAVGADTLVKVMTDGILLAEIQSDPLLRRYDTLIIDEAHERSLNIDFILGYLKRLLPRRPELKVIVTSATIDPERFAEHFGGPAAVPVLEVSGRTYPVQVRYRPIVDPDDPDADPDRDQAQAICDAVGELRAEGPGDILVFCSGEREIRDTADALGRLDLPETEILPLYARLSTAEQHRVFAPHRDMRIVLATNVAETSLTVPGIRYVIDPGTARISRYSARTKVQRLPIEPVSQASANQRKGRCGRLAAGICIRLYSEEDFESRAAFTEPEILRTNLASVILQMTAAGLGEVASFPFIDPPDRRNIADGMALLVELGALDADRRLTRLGRRLAQLPVDPRLGRMVLAAHDQGCVREVIVIAAALSIQDPRERPAHAQPQADALHGRFAVETSDFLAYLNLWRYLRDRQRELSSSQFRRLCRTEYLSWLRVREWQDVASQLRQLARGVGVPVPGGPDAEAAEPEPRAVHTALLAGLLSHVGLRDPERRDYLGGRGARFQVFPGSVLFARPPRFVVAAELVETSRLWGRICARIEPEWVEPLAGHLVRRSYSEPHWEARQGAVMAYEKVTLFGVPLVERRKINYARIDPPLARELFIRHALVDGDWRTQHHFFHHNRALLAEAEELEHRIRRRDIVVDDETLFGFYDRRLPAEVVSARHFDAWWKKARRSQPDLLTFTAEDLLTERAAGVSETDYPRNWQLGGLELPLSYHFEPGAPDDGVSVQVPLPVLNQISPDPFSWGVPGQREELVTALLRGLPKPVRRSFVPVPDTVRAVLPTLVPYRGALTTALSAGLRALTGIGVPEQAWRPDKVPDHLRPTFRVVDEQGRLLAEGKDLEALRALLRQDVHATLAAAGHDVERRGLRGWDGIGALPRVVERHRDGFVVTGYPALVDEGTSVAVRLMATEAEQQRAMWQGTRRLVLLAVASPAAAPAAAARGAGTPGGGGRSPLRLLRDRLPDRSKLVLARNPHGSVAALLDDCVDCAVDAIIVAAGGPAWDETSFAALRDAARAELADAVLDVVRRTEGVLVLWHAVGSQLAAMADRSVFAVAVADIRAQLDGLVYPGFVAATGRDRLPDLQRYLRGIGYRLEKLPDKLDRDATWAAQVAEVRAAYDDLATRVPASPQLNRIRWMIEELRISLFAQPVGTPQPISDKRIYRAMDELDVP